MCQLWALLDESWIGLVNGDKLLTEIQTSAAARLGELYYPDSFWSFGAVIFAIRPVRVETERCDISFSVKGVEITRNSGFSCIFVASSGTTAA
jgi:hypothetical protein